MAPRVVRATCMQLLRGRGQLAAACPWVTAMPPTRCPPGPALVQAPLPALVIHEDPLILKVGCSQLVRCPVLHAGTAARRSCLWLLSLPVCPHSVALLSNRLAAASPDVPHTISQWFGTSAFYQSQLQVSEDPVLLLVDGFLSPVECAAIRELGGPHLKRSKVSAGGRGACAGAAGLHDCASMACWAGMSCHPACGRMPTVGDTAAVPR